MVGHLPSTSHTRIGSEGTSSFLYVPQRLLISRTIPRLESHGIVWPIWIVHTSHRWPGEMHHPEIKPQNLQVIWNVQFITVFVPPWMIPHVYHRLRYPTYVCLPSGLYKARNGQIVAQTGSDQEIISLPDICFFDGWRVHPTLTIPSNLPRTKEAPVRDITHAAPSASTEPTRSPEEETRDILATAAKNQAGDGPNTRRAAVRACKYLRAMSINIVPSYKKCIKLPASTHNWAKAQQGRPRNIAHKEESSQ